MTLNKDYGYSHSTPPLYAIRIKRTARALSIKNDNDLKFIYPDFLFWHRFLMTNLNGFSVFNVS